MKTGGQDIDEARAERSAAMTTYKADEIKEAVRAHYGGRAEQLLAQEADPGCCGSAAGSGPVNTGYAAALYGTDAVAGLPETVVSYGCGNPTAIAGLRAGETVLDLGSGAGLDCFLAAKQVGEDGRAIGLDMTDSMIELARANQAKLGLTNVEFRTGEMEAMPLDDATVDVIISNCVINLSPDKDAVFRECFRVLRPGGRMHVSDIVLVRPLSGDEHGDLATWAGCASGALLTDDYRARLEAVGMVEVTIDITEQSERPWRSALITAYKPAADGRIVRAAAAKPLPALAGVIPLDVAGGDSACCGVSDSKCC
jgi:arsenite methyltransferase